MIDTKLTRLLGIEYPIIQSGMQWLAVPQLAAAVSNAGGIGTINLTCWPTIDEFADALDEMNSLTSKPYIVNISLAPFSEGYRRHDPRSHQALWREACRGHRDIRREPRAVYA